MTLEIVSVLFLCLFSLIAAIDGLYFHIYKYKLYSKKDSIFEHQLHTINAFLFPLSVLFLFVFNSAGLFLWIAIALTLLTLVVEFWDVFEERKSREHFGGLTSMEYAMHFGMSGLRATYTTLILAAKPAVAWTWSQYLLPQHYPIVIQVIGISIITLGIIIFMLHYYLGRLCEKSA